MRERQFIQGDNIFIPHPTQEYEVNEIPILGGKVVIIEYSDETVLVQVHQDGKQPHTWVNRLLEVDAATNTATILPKKK
ncbi:hypothetical protein J27TS7_08640 [Paenibacillus dendritiformis]|uniref:hypothetical protein n=1 Tax=Paenibacillus dendritiformis TaxID=130049 RepID=UPI001AFDD34E|nr:hypothetical protein [Paenibacillus dendritiformis]GIO71350.1 hypothetical protein J27TS7_08640 [Paenibacillus dendritiformis]